MADDTFNLSLPPPNVSSAGAGPHGVRNTTVILALNVVIVCVGLVGLALNSILLSALRRLRDSDLLSRWTLSHVVALDLAVCVREVLAGLVTFVLVPSCSLGATMRVLVMWVDIPLLHALLAFALDQVLAVFFPLTIRLNTRAMQKKVAFSLIIWLPPACLSVFMAVKWFTSNEPNSCPSFIRVLHVNVFAPAGVSALSAALILILYALLIVKILFFCRNGELGGRGDSREDNKPRYRRTAFTFFTVAITSVVMLMSHHVFALVETSLCKESREGICNRETSLIIRHGAIALLALNSCFDPVYVTLRLPVVNRSVRRLFRAADRGSTGSTRSAFESQSQMSTTSLRDSRM